MVWFSIVSDFVDAIYKLLILNVYVFLAFFLCNVNKIFVLCNVMCNVLHIIHTILTCLEKYQKYVVTIS